jgi:hypothetical protein
MARKSPTASRPIFHTPMLLDWTDEKLQTLSQEQLLNLLENLDRQRTIGRLPEHEAAAFDQRISSLLTSRNSARRRRQVSEKAEEAAAQG